jgi:hypothetical protein
MKALMGLSLFSTIGFEGEIQGETEWLSKAVGLTFSEFKDVIREQQRRGLVQGEYYLYLTPIILRVHLMREWWETWHLTPNSFLRFVESIPETFRADLMGRFEVRYLGASAAGRKFAREILGPSGLFDDGTLLKSDLGGDFFLSLVEVDPESAVSCLERTVGTWSFETLASFTHGRRQVVNALERIAIWRELFTPAARILLKLAEAENETWATNATGVFAHLFSPGPGQVAPTEASPKERFPVLNEALMSSSEKARAIAYKACDQALEAHQFSRTSGPEFQGVHRLPLLWKPQTYGELFEAYRRVWQILESRLQAVTGDEKDLIADILLRRTRSIIEIPSLSSMVTNTINLMLEEGLASKRNILSTVIQIIHFDKDLIQPETLSALEGLKQRLTGTSFRDRLTRYVGMSFVEDDFDSEGKPTDHSLSEIKRLALQSVESPQELIRELPSLVTELTDNASRFGYELGLADRAFSLLGHILMAYRSTSASPNTMLIGGYLRAMNEVDYARWEESLFAIAEDPPVRQLLPEITFRSGMSDKAARLVLNQAKDGILAAKDLQIFAFGSVMGEVSEGVFDSWIEYLLELGSRECLALALNLFHFYYLRKEAKHALPEQRGFQVLTHRSLFESAEHQQMEEYYWTGIGIAFLQSYPSRAIDLAAVILESFGRQGSVRGGTFSRTDRVINRIANDHPIETWNIVSKYLGPPLDDRSFSLRYWLRGGDHYEAPEGALTFFPPEPVFQWVEADIEERSGLIASFVPPKLFHEANRVCYAREVLVRYGKEEAVLGNLAANFSTEGWVGPGSVHYQNKKEELLRFKASESNPLVRKWIDHYVSDLEFSARRERIEEERRGL